MEELHRALGRLEGKIDQILLEQQTVRAEFVEHKGDDRQNFAIVSSRFGAVTRRLDLADEKRELWFTSSNDKLDQLNSYVDNIKGAWWLIGTLVVLVAGIGAAITWLMGLLPHR